MVSVSNCASFELILKRRNGVFYAKFKSYIAISLKNKENKVIIDHIAIKVDDLKVAEEWYCDKLAQKLLLETKNTLESR